MSTANPLLTDDLLAFVRSINLVERKKPITGSMTEYRAIARTAE